ncbi:MAG: glutaredoxin domain-containing protein [bacterium]
MPNPPKIKIYSTPTCPYCKAAKRYFAEKGLKFEDFDVSTDLVKAKEMIKLSGQMGVPVIAIGKTIIVGFEPRKLDEILEKNSLSPRA